MAAVAGDADNINKQARKMRTNWIKNKQAANGFLRSGRLALRTAPPHPSCNHVVPTIADVGSLVM